MLTSSGGKLEAILPPESFVGKTRGALLVYGWDIPSTGSEVHAIDLRSPCDVVLARVDDVLRTATLDLAGRALYLHTVTRDQRIDLGVKRIDLATRNIELVAEPMPIDEIAGPTFGTGLHWSLDEDELAVEACGQGRCRTRILDIDDGSVRDYWPPYLGPLVGFTAQKLFALRDMDNKPTQLLAIDRSTGRTKTLVEEAISASLSADTEGPVLTVETLKGTRFVRP